MEREHRQGQRAPSGPVGRWGLTEQCYSAVPCHKRTGLQEVAESGKSVTVGGKNKIESHPNKWKDLIYILTLQKVLKKTIENEHYAKTMHGYHVFCCNKMFWGFHFPWAFWSPLVTSGTIFSHVSNSFCISPWNHSITKTVLEESACRFPAKIMRRETGQGIPQTAVRQCLHYVRGTVPAEWPVLGTSIWHIAHLCWKKPLDYRAKRTVTWSGRC